MKRDTIKKYGHHNEVYDYEEDLEIYNESTLEEEVELDTEEKEEINPHIFYDEFVSSTGEKDRASYMQYLIQKSITAKNIGDEEKSNYIYKVYLSAVCDERDYYKEREEESEYYEIRDRIEEAQKDENWEAWEYWDNIKKNREEEKRKKREHLKLLGQIVERKIERVLSGESIELTEDEYEYLKEKVFYNYKRVEDTGVIEGASAEMISFNVSDKYFNVEKRSIKYSDIKKCEMSFSEECSTEKYGYMKFKPYDSFTKEEFIESIRSSENNNLTLEELQKKLEEMKNGIDDKEVNNIQSNIEDIDKKLAEAREIARLANEKVKYLEEVKKAKELLQEYEKHEISGHTQDEY